MKLTRRQVLGLAPTLAAAFAVGCSNDKEEEQAGEGSSSGSGEGGEQEPEHQDEVEAALSKLTLEQKVAQLFVCVPETLTGVGLQTRAGDATREAFEALPVGGICWFGQNLEDPAQCKEMLGNVNSYSKNAVGLPIINAVDEEGGRVARVANNSAFGIENVGDMRNFGEDGDVDAAGKAASTIAAYLTDLGFNTNFAPDSDVVSSAANVDLVWRSFGTEPDLVADMVAAQVKGYTEGGILCSPKHFPGIGYASGDSEVEVIESDRTLEEMLECELKPFKAGIEAGAPLIMVGHLNCPELSDVNLPASLNKEIIQGILREELGFKGLVICDSLGMGAVTNITESINDLALMAFEAGNDLLLCPANLQGSYNVLLEAVRNGRVTEERVDESCRRIIKAKLSLA